MQETAAFQEWQVEREILAAQIFMFCAGDDEVRPCRARVLAEAGFPAAAQQAISFCCRGHCNWQRWIGRHLRQSRLLKAQGRLAEVCMQEGEVPGS